MTLQCFENIADHLKSSMRVLNVEFFDREIAEKTIPVKGKFSLVIYYDGEGDFEYDMNTEVYSNRINGGLVLFGENLSDEKSNKEAIGLLETIKTNLIGHSPPQSTPIRITGISELDRVENFVRYQIKFEFYI